MANTIYLYGEVGYDFSDKSFAAELEKYPESQRLTVAINSPGGDVFQGQAINALIKARGGVDARIDGLAASAASYMGLSADSITISSGGMMMIHKPMAFAFGNAFDFGELIGLLEKVEASVLIPAYARKMGIDAEKVKELLADETWYSSEEAVEANLVDGYSDQPAVLNRLPSKFSNIYRKIPDRLRPEDGASLASSRVLVAGGALGSKDASRFQDAATDGHRVATEPVSQDYSVYQARLRLLGVL